MHQYTVEFRIHGIDLDVSSVTVDLGLEPSLIRRAGEHRSKTEQWAEAMWAYNGFPEVAGSKHWTSLEEGLSFVLEKLWPVRNKLDTYRGKRKLILWCGHFQSSFDGGPSLSPAILQRLGEFGADLYLDTYLSDDSVTEGSDLGSKII